MKIPYWHIDAFTSIPHHGNPAGVCFLDKWLDEEVMQNIAFENNLSETAFIVKTASAYQIKWFTPTSEINLCGHATLASGFVVLNFIEQKIKKVLFNSPKYGELSVEKENGLFLLNFPAIPPQKCETPANIIKAFGKEPVETLVADDYLVVLDKEEDIKLLNPDFDLLKQLDARGVIVTAQGNNCDFVSRFFGPKFGIDEDPVTGSAHCSLIPYWKVKLQKDKFHAVQLSKRGGELFCKDHNDRVTIAGNAVCYLNGTITI